MEYISIVRNFSRNAKLYILHVVGMDLIWGTWNVLFNLYLLAGGFGIDFIALRILIAGISSALFSIPAGWLSDKLGRKVSFVVGDGLGAVVAAISILTLNPTLLLILPVLASFGGALHHVSEDAFMAENSREKERTYLFSVTAGISTLAMMVGSIIAGFVPGMLEGDKLMTYRVAASFGIILWFLSLIPAVMLKGEDRSTREPTAIKNPKLIMKYVAVTGIATFAMAMAGSTYNVFFHEHTHASEEVIGITFAVSSGILGLFTFIAPLVARWLGDVKSVVVLQSLAVPFIISMVVVGGNSHHEELQVISLVGFVYMARTLFMNIASPILSAFFMNILDRRERATATGIKISFGYMLSAISGYLGANMMSHHDFQGPFIWMSVLFSLSVLLFWILFRRYENKDNTGNDIAA
jgi:MFS family permease